MSRIFLSHSSLDAREAIALKQWLAEQSPPLADEIVVDIDAETGTRWDLFGDGPTTAIDIGDGGEPIRLATAGLHRLRDGLRGVDEQEPTGERPATAEADAARLRRRSRILSAALAVAAIVAVVAVIGFVRADRSSDEATRQFHTATAARLTAESQAMLDGSRAGGDIRALQQLLAAGALTGTTDPDALYDTVVARAATDRVLSTPGMVYAPVYSPDGNLVATGNSDGKVRIWDTRSWQPVGQPLDGHNGSVAAVEFSSDGSRIISAGSDGTVRIWEVATGQPVRAPFGPGAAEPIGPEDQLLAVGLSEDGRFAFTRDAGGHFRVWNVETGEPEGGPAFSNIGPLSLLDDRLAAVNQTHPEVVELQKLHDGTKIAELRGHTGDIRKVTFSPDGRLLLTASMDGTLRLWDGHTGAPVGEPLRGHAGEVLAAAFSPDGRLVAAGGGDSVVRIWDVASGNQIGDPLTGFSGLVLGLGFSPDGRHIVAGGSDHTLRIWTVSAALPLPGQIVAFGPDGDRIAVAATDGMITVWDPATMAPIGAPLDTGIEVTAVQFGPDGNRLLVVGPDGAVRLWNPDTGQPVDTAFPGAGQALTVAAAFSPDGRRIAVGDRDGAITVWDTDSGQPVGERVGLDGSVVALEFLDGPDTLVAVLDDGAGNGVLTRWDLADASQRENFEAGPAAAAALAPGGALLSGGPEGTVGFRAPGSYELIAEPVVLTDAVTAAAFRADGQRAVTGSRSHGVRLWDAAQGRPIGRQINGLTTPVVSAALSSDGRFLAAGDAAGNTRIWPASASPEQLCAKLTENMSHRQWSQWVSPDIDYVTACPDLPVAPD